MQRTKIRMKLECTRTETWMQTVESKGFQRRELRFWWQRRRRRHHGGLRGGVQSSGVRRALKEGTPLLTTVENANTVATSFGPEFRAATCEEGFQRTEKARVLTCDINWKGFLDFVVRTLFRSGLFFIWSKNNFLDQLILELT